MFNLFKYKFYIRRIKQDKMIPLKNGIKHLDLNINKPSIVFFISDIKAVNIYNKVKTKKMFFKVFTDKNFDWVQYFPATGLLYVGGRCIN